MDVGLPYLVASLVLGWTAGTVLQWIARPAANAQLPELTSRRALLEIAAGVAAVAWTGRRSLLLLAALMLAVRIAMGLSYQAWGGIRPVSLIWVRVSLAAAVLLIGCLPESFL